MPSDPDQHPSTGDPVDRVAIAGHARKSVRWVFWGRIVLQLVSLAFTFVLARLLDPGAFGLYGMAFVILQLVNYVEALRLESALIQAAGPSRDEVSAAWGFALTFGAVCAGLTYGLSSACASILEAPALASLLRAGSLVFLVRAVFFPARVHLRRELRFRSLTLIEILRVVPSGLVAVWLAWSGFGAWALLAFYLLRELVGGLFMAVAAGPWKLPSVRFGRIRTLLPFGVSSSTSELLIYGLYNAPDLFTGRFIGIAPLGNFRQGVALVNRPIAYVDDVLNKLAFPFLSRVWVDPDAVSAGFRRGLALLFAITLPISVLTFVLADEFVRILYGIQWNAAVPVVRIIAVAAVARILHPLNSAVFHAAGRPSTEVRLNLAGFVLLLTLLFVVRPDGIVAISYIVAGTWLLLALVGLVFSSRTAFCSLADVLAAARWPVVATAAMSAVTSLAATLLNDVSLLLRTGGVAVVGLGTYLLVLSLLDRGLLKSAVSTVFRRPGTKRESDNG